MEYGSDFKNFLQDIYNKVSIATAISVIRTKPDYLTLEEHVEEIQKSCKKAWQNKSEVPPFENRIILLQQNIVLKQINNLLPTAASQDDSEFGSDEWFPCKIDLNLPKPFEEIESSSDNESVIEDNAEFMHAVIKLKFAVNTRKKIVLQRLNNSSKSDLPVHPLKKFKTINKNSHSTETDSGFYSNEGNYERKTFSTCLLSYVTNSSDTDLLITKCLETIFKYIKATFRKGTLICFNYWKESILEKIVHTLKEVCIDDICLEAVTTFIEDILEEIWSCEEENKHTDWEYQCHILNELCCNSKICINILHFLLYKINNLNKTLLEINIPSTNKNELSLIEKIPYFIDMISSLLSKWKKFNNISKDKIKNNLNKDKVCLEDDINIEENITNDLIANFWKEQWTGEGIQSKKTVEELQNKEILRKYKESFEKLISCTINNYSLISQMALRVISIVENFSANDQNDLLNYDNQDEN